MDKRCSISRVNGTGCLVQRFYLSVLPCTSAKAGGVTPSFSGVHQLKWYQNSTATCLCDLSVNYHLINNHVNSVHIEYDLHKVKEFKICNVNDCTGHFMCLSCNFVNYRTVCSRVIFRVYTDSVHSVITILLILIKNFLI